MSEKGLNRDIFERDRSGEPISIDEPEYPKLKEVILRAVELTTILNTSVHDENEIRSIFSELTGSEVDDSFWVIPPFYTDFGRNIKVGKNVFINHACTFMDRGGITIEDDTKIGPKVNLITSNHPLDPAHRRKVVSTPIWIKKNVWIGAAATILPGVTVGENSVVAAASVVTQDVPPNTVVAGVPAKVIRTL